jgi:hypothetical protein
MAVLRLLLGTGCEETQVLRTSYVPPLPNKFPFLTRRARPQDTSLPRARPPLTVALDSQSDEPMSNGSFGASAGGAYAPPGASTSFTDDIDTLFGAESGEVREVPRPLTLNPSLKP